MQGACQELPVAYESWSLSKEHLSKEARAVGHLSPKGSSAQGWTDPEAPRKGPVGGAGIDPAGHHEDFTRWSSGLKELRAGRKPGTDLGTSSLMFVLSLSLIGVLRQLNEKSFVRLFCKG